LGLWARILKDRIEKRAMVSIRTNGLPFFPGYSDVPVDHIKPWPSLWWILQHRGSRLVANSVLLASGPMVMDDEWAERKARAVVRHMHEHTC
jgi:hypothetical protein